MLSPRRTDDGATVNAFDFDFDFEHKYLLFRTIARKSDRAAVR